MGGKGKGGKGGGGLDPGTTFKTLFACGLIASLCVYTIEFIGPASSGNLGYIALYIFIYIALIVAAYCLIADNSELLTYWIVAFAVLVTVDGVLVGWMPAYVTGGITLALGVIHKVVSGG